VEHTHRLMVSALRDKNPGGAPSEDLQAVCDQLLEASIPAVHKDSSSALAADRRPRRSPAAPGMGCGAWI
jgi:hypothetical protein